MKFLIPQIIFTEQGMNSTVCKPFAKGCGSKNTSQAKEILSGKTKLEESIATYGILRGCSEVMKLAKDFWYIDHGYFKQSGAYYRVCHNCHIARGDGNYPKDRLNKFGVKLKDWRKSGSHIVLCPPSGVVQEHLGIGSRENKSQWTLNVIEELKKYTDRDIFISTKCGDGVKDFKKIPPKNPFRKSFEKCLGGSYF